MKSRKPSHHSRFLVLAYGVAIGSAGCGESVGTAEVVQNQKSASEAWNQAKADGSLKRKPGLTTQQKQGNTRGHSNGSQ